MMFEELDAVTLTIDLSTADLKKGAVGTIVTILGGGDAFMVEFNAEDGRLIALPIVSASDIRPATSDDIERYRSKRPTAAE